MSTLSDFAKLAWYAIRRGKKKRNVENVEKEYTLGWNASRQKLEKSKTIEEWLHHDPDDMPRYYNINGKFVKKIFASETFYKETLLDTLEKYYPDAQSVAEFGCGTGQNLVYLHLRHPHLKLYGFELCQAGVDIGNEASKKFNLPIQFFKLDYLNWIPSDIVMPQLDVAFTNFSFEQIPENNQRALGHIMSHVDKGTFHLEPVVENYPWNIKGLVGRIDHYKVGYLKNFGRSARAIVGKNNIIEKTLKTAHNPLMYPSLYVLKKR